MNQRKAIFISVGVVAAIFLLLVAVKASQIFAMINAGKHAPVMTETVGVFQAHKQEWPQEFTAVGTVEADEGINIGAEVAGKVQKILFKSGEFVKAGTVLLIQESGNELGQLNAAQARLKLADSNYDRIVQLRQKNLVSQNDLDTALQQKGSAQGDVDNLKTTLEKKVVRAPFDGRLGIRKADLGQDLKVGDAIVSLQATHRVRVNFPVPQYWLVKMSKGLPMSVELGDGSNAQVKGEITAVGADINPSTRNATVQSSLENSSNRFVPGMAVKVIVTLSNPQKIMAVPVTSVIFAPFGDTIFIVDKDKDGNLVARQQFVRLGQSRGDFIEIIDGLKEGEQVVQEGAFKLVNGMRLMIGKQPSPEFKTNPTPADT